MGGSHTIVHRPVSEVYNITVTANATTTPVQLVANTNEVANFVYLLNTSTTPVLVRLRNNNQAQALAFPASGASTPGFVLPANQTVPIVINATFPCWISAFATANATLYVQLMQNQ